jgi:hypothetical protein
LLGRDTTLANKLALSQLALRRTNGGQWGLLGRGVFAMASASFLQKLLSPRGRVYLAVALLAVAALASGRYASRLIRHYREGYESQYAKFEARLTPLDRFLPRLGTIGYLVEANPSNDPLLNAYRFSLVAYHVLPCKLEQNAVHEFVLFDADDPDSMPAQAATNGWTLVARGGQGLKLFRTRPAPVDPAPATNWGKR